MVRVYKAQERASYMILSQKGGRMAEDYIYKYIYMYRLYIYVYYSIYFGQAVRGAKAGM